MRLPGTLILAVLAAAARAGDPPAPAADSIADAKKDLASIKSSAGQPDSGAALPALDMRDVNPGPVGAHLDTTPVISPEKDASLDPTRKKEGTGNWLVDAMDKKSDRSPSSKSKDRDDLLRGEQDLLKGDERLAARADRDTASLEESRDRPASKDEATGPAYNPLASFMGGWISPRDHDLLLPSSKTDGLSGAGAEKARSDLLPGLEIGQQGSAAETLLPPESAPFGESTGAANPYLAALDLGPGPQAKSIFSPEPAGFAPFGPAEISSGVSSFGAAPKASDSSRSFVPDFAQPPDDDKYFKQMKKF
jgi:hypothetical protein